MTIVERLEHHWFAPARLRDLAYLRIAVVLVLLAGTLWPGVLEMQLLRSRLPAEWFVSLPALKLLMLPFGWGVRPGPALITIVWGVACVSGLLALVGAHTRASLAIFAWTSTILVVHSYSYGTLEHPKAIATIILWALLLAPCGEELSLDSVRANVAESRRRGRFIPRDDVAMRGDARWPLRLAQWLLVLAYLSAGLSKVMVGKGAWLNGYTMTYYLLNDGISHGLGWSVAIAHLRWLGVASAIVTVAFELTFVVAVLRPRTFPVYAAIGTGLHTAIFLLLWAPFFQFVALYAAWAESLRESWRRWVGARNSARVWTLVYDGSCPLCIRTMTQLDVLDGSRVLRYVDLEREPERARALLPGVSHAAMRDEMAVVTPAGSVLRGFFAFRELAKRFPVSWPIVPLICAPGAAWLGTRVYPRVAAYRARLVCEGERCAVHAAGHRAPSAGAAIDFEGSAS